jgi:hypothetical protein
MPGNAERELPDPSLDDSAPGRDRRQDPRQATVHVVAKLRTVAGEALCLIRNISPGGLTAHVYTTLDIGGAVTFEFPSGAVIPASIVWQRDSVAGAQFAARVDIATVFGLRDRSPPAPEPRAPRIELDVPATIRLGTRHRAITLNNISQGGAKIHSTELLDPGLKLTLLVNGLAPLSGRVRWNRDGFAGVAFYTPVPFDLLALWLSMAQTPNGSDTMAG